MGRTRVIGKVGVAVVVVVLCIPFLKTDGYYDVREHMNKRGVRSARQEGDIELTRWDPIAKIDVLKTFVVDEETGERILRNRLVAYDGGNQSSRLYPFDGNYVGLRDKLENDLTGVVDHFWNRSVIASIASRPTAMPTSSSSVVRPGKRQRAR